MGSENIVKASLLPCLVELSSDENMIVRAAAVDSVVYLIPYLGAGKIKLMKLQLNCIFSI